MQTTTSTAAPVYINPYTSQGSPVPLATALLLAAIACFAGGMILAQRRSFTSILSLRTRASGSPIAEPARQSA